MSTIQHCIWLQWCFNSIYLWENKRGNIVTDWDLVILFGWVGLAVSFSCIWQCTTPCMMYGHNVSAMKLDLYLFFDDTNSLVSTKFTAHRENVRIKASHTSTMEKTTRLSCKLFQEFLLIVLFGRKLHSFVHSHT